MTAGKGTMRVTIHLKEFAPKSARLDDAPLQTRVAQKGKDVVEMREKDVVEMRDDDRVTLLTVPWEMIRPVSEK